MQIRPVLNDEAIQLALRYLQLIEHDHGLSFTHNLEGALLSINRAAAWTLGYEPSDLIGHTISELLSPESQQEFALYLERITRECALSGQLTFLDKSCEEHI